MNVKHLAVGIAAMGVMTLAAASRASSNFQLANYAAASPDGGLSPMNSAAPATCGDFSIKKQNPRRSDCERTNQDRLDGETVKSILA